jgi:hypothetical protein
VLFYLTNDGFWIGLDDFYVLDWSSSGFVFSLDWIELDLGMNYFE